MAKIIKKPANVETPVSVGLTGAPGVAASKGESDLTKLAFSNLVNENISHIRDTAAIDTENSERKKKSEIENSFDQGYQKGLVEGAQQERNTRIKSISALMIEAKKKNTNAIRNMELRVVDLAVTIAEKFLRKQLEADTSSVETILSEIMSNIIGSETVILKVSAYDFQLINSKYNEWMSSAGNVSEFRIEIDKRLRTGDFVVETEGGIIDGVIENRIDVLVETLLKTSL